jgi:hypothetical protein
MGSRDHLIPSLTVDRNGHAKTVYVSPGGNDTRSSSLSSAIPTLSRFEEAEDDGDADNSGFGPEWEGVSDPESWECNDFSADDAQDWAHEGFDSDDAYGWRAAGFDHAEAKEWSSSFSVDDAREWNEGGFTPDVAGEWSNAGFLSDDAAEWRNEAFDDASTARSWSSEGFDPREAMQWHEGGFTDPIDASNWKDATRSRRDIEISDLAVLSEKETLPEDAPMWLAVLQDVQRLEAGKNATLEDVVDVLNGVNPSASDAYGDFRYPDQWRILARAHVEFDKVQAVQTAYQHIDDFQAEEYGDDYEEDVEGTLETAAAWIGSAEGFTWNKSQAIFALIRDGHSPSRFEVFLANSSETLGYDKENPDAIVKAQEWAVSSTGKDAPMFEKTTTFERFYTAIREIDDMDEIIEKHGAAKVRDAMSQGMLTGPTLRNYLDYIPVAGISEGAL